MHSAQHASKELVNPITLMYERYQGGYSALIVGPISEVRKDELLEGIDLVLEGCQIGDGLVTFVWIVDSLQADVLLILEGAVKLRVVSVKLKLLQEEINVFTDKRSVSPESFSAHAAGKTLNPLRMLLRFLKGYRSTLL